MSKISRAILLPELKTACERLLLEQDQIPADRRLPLEALGNYVKEQYASRQQAQLIAICTHNSRRSHLLQIWSAMAADFFRLPPIATYSGGTESTAFHPNAVAALQRLGFRIKKEEGAVVNPVYQVQWTKDGPPYEAFSKRYDEAPNPTKGFAAVMVCDEADNACPIIKGADLRVTLPYSDPKEYDGMAEAATQYDARAWQIGREILYCFAQIR